MNILCTICSDLVNSAESVCVTKCGHIFHHHCLAQWNERSKTCPQCRHSITAKCLFRIYPTISNEASVDDIATLQSRLDDAKLTTRQQAVKIKELEDNVLSLSADLKKNEKILHETEKKLVTKDSAVCALKEQLEYVKVQNKEREKLKEENGMLQRNLQTLNGLQKVLNATTEEVEKMLESYTDVRTIATFAAALKRALCESESRKNESRDRLLHTQTLLSKEKKDNLEWQHKYLVTYEKLKEIEENMEKIEHIHKEIDHKRQNQQKNKSPSKENENYKDVRTHQLDLAFCGEQMDLDRTYTDISFSDDEKQENKTQNKLQNSMVNRIENSDSPYLALKQSTMLPLSAIQRKQTKMAPVSMKPSDYMMLNKARKDIAPSTSQKPNLDLSIFHKRPAAQLTDVRNSIARNHADSEILYDGLGGHSKLDIFPVLKSPVKSKSVPILTAKHKLKRPVPSGSQDIASFMKRIKDK